MLQTIALYVALAVFGLGLIYKVLTWFRYTVGFNAKDLGAGRRVAAAGRGMLRTVFSAKFFTLSRIFFSDVLLQLKLFRHDRLRWFAHMCIVTGFMAVFLTHAMSRFTTSVLFPDYLPTRNPFLFIRDVSATLVLLGLAISVYRRFLQKGQRPPTNSRDVYALAIIALIILSGVLLEGVKVSSHSLYREMVEEYAGGEDDDTLRSLEAYWVNSFGVASPDAKAPFDAARLAQGEKSHRALCMECHAHARWGFLGYGTAKAMGPTALAADRANLRTILLYVHFLACFMGLALLPFSKMLHIFTGPLSLMANAVMANSRTDPANVATRQVLELDACTHCGMCTARCAVAVAFEEIPNVNILPSEKIAAIRDVAAGRGINAAALGTIQQGIYLCTNCYRCTLVCPVGINLQDLWFNVREGLLERDLPELLILSPFSLYRGLMKQKLDHGRYERPADLTRQAISSACDLEKVRNRMVPLEPGNGGKPDLSGYSFDSSSFSNCYGCMTCTNVCPVVRSYSHPMEELGLLPHQIMHAMGLRLWDLVLSSRMLWDCLSCYQCQTHCPMSVHATDIIYELRNLAIEHAIEKSSRPAGGKP